MSITLNGDSGITNVNGTAAAPAITGTDTDSGMYFGTNTVALSTSGTAALSINSSQVVSLTNALPVASGGTGAATLTANNVLLGNGTSAVQAVAPGTSGNVLTSNGTTWSSSALPAGGVTSLNGQTGAITNTSLYAIGSYITGRPANNTTDYQVDSTIAGSSLYTTPPGAARSGAGTWLSVASGTMTAGVALINTGTWRCVSPALRDTSNAFGLPGLWVRIS